MLAGDTGASSEPSLSSVVPAGLRRAVKSNGRSKVSQAALQLKEEGGKGNKKKIKAKSQATSGILQAR